jgi:hypothetical protein
MQRHGRTRACIGHDQALRANLTGRRRAFTDHSANVRPSIADPCDPMPTGHLRTQAGQLDLHICAVTRRGERDLN